MPWKQKMHLTCHGLIHQSLHSHVIFSRLKSIVLVIEQEWQGWMEVIKNENLLMRIFLSQGLILSVFSIRHAAYSCEQLTLLSCPLRRAGNMTLRLTKTKHDKTEKSSLNGPAYHTSAAEPCAVILLYSETSQAQQGPFTFLSYARRITRTHLCAGMLGMVHASWYGCCRGWRCLWRSGTALS